MRNAVLIAVVLVAAMCVAPVWSHGGPGGPPPGRGAIPPPPSADMIDSITTALSLTTDQATALTTVLTANDATIEPLVEAAKTAEKAVRDAFTAADFDSAATLAVTASDAQLAVTKACIDGWAAIQSSEILTTDQFATLLTTPCGAPPSSGSGSSSSGSSTSGGSSSSSAKRHR